MQTTLNMTVICAATDCAVQQLLVHRFSRTPFEPGMWDMHQTADMERLRYVFTCPPCRFGREARPLRVTAP